MARVGKMTFTFEDASGTVRAITYSKVSTNVATSSVRAVATALVTNGSILKYPPAVVTGATLYITDENPIDLYDD